MQIKLIYKGVIAVILLSFILVGCSEDLFVGEKRRNKKPEVWLSSGPIEGDTVSYLIHFYWGGWDPDGEIAYYEFAIVDGHPFGFDPEDTMGLDKWHKTQKHDSIFVMSADVFSKDTTIVVGSDAREYSIYDKSHTFFIRAVDDKGLRSDTEYSSFTAWTFAPTAEITYPKGARTLNRIITIKWKGSDPIDSPNNSKEPDSVRYLLTVVPDTFPSPRDYYLVQDLNKNPMKYEHLWQDWVYYRAPEDSGRSVILGKNKPLVLGRNYLFAVQAKDDAGAVTSIFKLIKSQMDRGNVLSFSVGVQMGPLITLKEKFLGTHRFIAENTPPVKFDLPPGVSLSFSWTADASSYAGEVVAYSYGWDVDEINNPDSWEVYRDPFARTAPEKTFYSGVHRFYVEAVDNANTRSIGIVEINIIPFTMTRNLLFIDDYYSTDFVQRDWAIPTETQHDQFWMGLCSKAEGFDPEQDVYDSKDYNYNPPDIKVISKYKNIIWVYNSSRYDAAWQKLVKFYPESFSSPPGMLLNYLPIFLTKGGHIMTSGDGKRMGGLAAVIPIDGMQFPMNLKCDFIQISDECNKDTSSVDCMAYKDYCVTVLDKITPVAYRQDERMPPRRLEDYDAFRYAYKDTTDEVTSNYPLFPSRLDLWEEITKPGRFYSIYDFDLVELYDTEYWMEITGVNSQPCFHPIYRMKTENTGSVINDAVIAIWITKYEDIVPDVDAGIAVAAPSIHFGFPLWYFEHDKIEQIVEIIFDKWGILKNGTK